MATAKAAMMEKNKAVTRLLQHSILQLCNEHVGYTHRLQILGVLCMTVDDEQQELVVKVNNTLKRVNPATPVKETAHISPIPQTVPTFTTMENGSLENSLNISSYMNANNVTEQPEKSMYSASSNKTVSEAESGIVTMSPSQLSVGSRTPGRKGHGRKGAKPVKVHHVYDEGELMDEDDNGDVMTVFPTDPESPVSTSAAPLFPTSFSPVPVGSQMDDEEEDVARTLSGSSHKRKSPYQHRAAHHIGSSQGEATSPPPGLTAPAISASTVRALLMKSLAGVHASAAAAAGTGADTPDEGALTPNSSPYHISSSPRLGLSLPVCIAPDNNGDSYSQQNHNDDASSNGGDLIIDYSGSQDNSSEADRTNGASPLPNGIRAENHLAGGRMYVEMDDNVIKVKEEPGDDYDYDLSSRLDADDLSQQLAAHQNSFGIDGLDHQLATQAFYGNLNMSSASEPEGLTIKYTSTGPVTVNSSGKEVTTSKVKDIIMFDDRMPLHMQKGNRIETDYMVDSLGMEGSGRKRRRRGPEETLTMEEITEYLGTQPDEMEIYKCKYCETEANSLVRYLQHTLTAHNAYICHQCGKSFTTKSSLLRHRPIHTGMRRFACSICKKTFYRKDKCKAHIKRHLGSDPNVDMHKVDTLQTTLPIGTEVA